TPLCEKIFRNMILPPSGELAVLLCYVGNSKRGAKPPSERNASAGLRTGAKSCGRWYATCLGGQKMCPAKETVDSRRGLRSPQRSEAPGVLVDKGGGWLFSKLDKRACWESCNSCAGVST